MKNEDNLEERERVFNGLAYFAFMKVYNDGLTVVFDNISYRLSTDDNTRALLVTNLHTNEETKIPIAFGYSMK